MALGLEGFHHPGFLVRREFGEHSGPFHFPCQLLSIHLFQVAAQKDVFHRQPHLTADAPGGLFIVPSEHLGGDPVIFQGFDGFGGTFLGRIQEGQVAQ